MLYTKNGEPLEQRGDDIFDSRGRHVARLCGAKAFNSRGRYVATLVGDRLVYRSTDSASIGSVFAPRVGSPFAGARRAASALLGEEPNFDR
jgi:hypothetical protein